MADEKPGAAAPAEPIKPVEIPDSATITLGGKRYDVGQMTLGTLRKMWPLFQRSGTDLEARFDLACQVVVEGLKPFGGPPDLDSIKTNYDEVFTAYQEVAKISGLIAMGERAARQSNGEGFTASSQIAP